MREEFVEQFHLILITNEQCCYEKTLIFDKWFCLSLNFAFKDLINGRNICHLKKYILYNEYAICVSGVLYDKLNMFCPLWKTFMKTPTTYTILSLSIYSNVPKLSMNQMPKTHYNYT